MINTNVMKHTNKKFNIQEVETVEDEEVRRPQLQQLEFQDIVEEPPENEQRIEEIIQQSGNVVSNIADITLKEATIAEVLLPPNQSAEAIRQESPHTFPRSILENMEEQQEATIVQVRAEDHVEPPIPEVNMTVNEHTRSASVSEPRRVSVQMDLDIADMTTQKVQTLSQARKRKVPPEIVVESPKRRSSSGQAKLSRPLANQQSLHVPPVSCPVSITDVEVDKENVPANLQQPRDAEMILSSKLQEAGLADIIQPLVPEVEAHTQTQLPLPAMRRTGSDRSETPLGSLDRTKVSLGDSEQTTDSKRFIRDHWGTEGTMIKIMKHIKAGLQPMTVVTLLDIGPVISGYRRIIAARCFTSILKLKQHGFIDVHKNPDTLEIADITLGPKLKKRET